MKIKNKIIISFTTLFVAIFLIIGSFIYFNNLKYFSKVIDKQVEQTLITKEKDIFNFIDSITFEMTELSKSKVLVSKDENLITQFLNENLQERKRIYESLFYTDISGEGLLENGNVIRLGNNEYFKELVSGNKNFVISRPTLSSRTGKSLFTILVMVKDNAGNKVGVLGNNILLDTISQMVNQTIVGESGYCWIIDDTGTMVAHPNEEERMSSTLSNGKSMSISEENTKDILNNIESSIIGSSNSGEKISIITKKISNSPNWTFGITIPIKEKYSVANKMVYKMIVYLIVGMAFIVIMAFIISSSILTPIYLMQSSFNKLSEGDLSVSLKVNTKDEIGELSLKFNDFVLNLKNIIENIIFLSTKVIESNENIKNSMDVLINGKESNCYEKTSEGMDSGIIQLNHSISVVLDNVRNQGASVEESLSALEQIENTNDNINRNIEKTNLSFKNTLEIAESGVYNINNMTTSMEEIKESSYRTENEIEKLIGMSNSIGSITVAINSIAEQTNLLALNAALEAARAGEAGRGFSVVADEIRKLAEQTNKETGKIEELVVGIQREVNMVKDGSLEVKEKVGGGLSLSLTVQKMIHEIMKNNNRNVEEMKVITNSVKEETVAAKEITHAVNNLALNSEEIEMLSLETMDISNKIKNTILNHQSDLEGLEILLSELKESLRVFNTK